MQVAVLLIEKFPETLVATTVANVVAQHYTQGRCLGSKVIPYWQRAGQQAAQRSANTEVVQHLTTGPGAARHAP